MINLLSDADDRTVSAPFSAPQGNGGLPVFLTVGQVATIWQVSIRTVFRWVQAGDLPVHVVNGRLIRFHPQDVMSLGGVQRRARSDSE